jgi:hypothetical protein
MKSVDIKKHLRGDRGGFKHAILFVSLILFFSPSNQILSQIFLNGFNQISKYSTFNNKLHIEPLDFNNDSFIDIFLYGSKNERITVHPGNSRFSFTRAIDKFFYYLISDFKEFNTIEGLDKNYIFISRKERLAGIVSFTKYGTLRLLNTLQFESYPSNLCIADIDNDGQKEALIFGNNFNGFSIISQNQFKLSQKKYFPNRIFSDAIFVDLDYDSFPEIVAIDELRKNLVFFSFDQTGKIREERELEIDHSSQNLVAADMDDDGFEDLLFSTTKGIQILKGDSVSSFTKRELIKLNSEPAEFLIADFNGDSQLDICYLSIAEGKISISFNQNKTLFNDPIELYQNDNLVDIKYFSNENKKILILLSKTGDLYTINNFDGELDNFNIPLTSSKNLFYFGEVQGQNQQVNFVFNKSSQQLRILKSVDSFFYDKIIEYNLIESYDNVKIFTFSNELLGFYFWNDTCNFIDQITYNENIGVFNTERIFAERPIKNFSSKIRDSKTLFHIISVENDSLYLTIQSSLESENNYLAEYLIDTNVIEAQILSETGDSIYYWTVTDSSLHLKQAYLNNSNIIYKEFFQ